MTSKVRAFPSNSTDDKYAGMDLRDYFAAKAMAVFLSEGSIMGYDYPDIAKASYMAADAMMAERIRGENKNEGRGTD